MKEKALFYPQHSLVATKKLNLRLEYKMNLKFRETQLIQSKSPIKFQGKREV